MALSPAFRNKIHNPKTFLGKVARMPLKLVRDNRVVRVKSGINKGALWITA
jgi:hypothetical protein